MDGSVVTQAYKDLYNGYVERFGEAPIDLFPEVYNTARAFFKFLDGQDTMDTTAWVDGFAKYRWQGIWGHEDFVAGKPVFGINRFCLNSSWASEWKDGKLYTDWVAPMPYELFVEQ